MNANITITLTASPELMQVFSLLSGALGNAPKSAAALPVTKAAKVIAETKPVPQEVDTATTPPTVAEQPVPQEKVTVQASTTISIDDIRKAIQAKAIAGKRTEAKDLLTSFKADSVSSLDPEKYEEFINQLNAL